MCCKIKFKRALILLSRVFLISVSHSCIEKNKNSVLEKIEKSNITYFTHSYFTIPDAYYSKNNYDSAIAHYKETAAKFLQEGNWEGQVRALYLTGNCFSRIIYKNESKDSALFYINLSLKIAEKNLTLDNITRFRAYYYQGEYYYNSHQPDSAFISYKKCEELLHNYFAEDHPAYADIYTSLGDAYYSLKGDFHKAEEYYSKALVVNLKIKANPFDLANNYYNLASTYREKGDYLMALESNKQAFKIFNNQIEFRKYIAYTYNNEANIYHDMDSSGLTIKSYKKAIDLNNNSNKLPIENYLNNIAAAYIQLGNFDSAKFYIAESIKNNPHLNNQFEFANSCFNLGEIFRFEKQWDSSEVYYKRALALRIKLYGQKHSSTALCIQAFGELCSEQGNIDSALSYYQNSLCILVKDFKDSVNIFSNPSDTSIVQGSLELIGLFYEKGLAFEKKYFSNKENSRLLEAAFQCYSLANHVIDLNRISYQREGSKLFLVSSYRKVYDHAVYCAYLLHTTFGKRNYADSLFNIMEKTKYALLLEDLCEAEKGKKLTNANAEEREEKKAMRSNQRSLTLSETQNHLTNTQEVIEYYWGDTVALVMGITKKEIKIHKIENKKVLENDIRRYLELLTTDAISPDILEQLKKFKEYSEISHSLYSTLVEKVIIKNQWTRKGGQTLVITPDGILSFMPFESLTTKAHSSNTLNYKPLPYLLKEYCINYSYSSNILFNYLQKRKNQILSPPLFLGYFNDKVKQALPDSLQKNIISSSGAKAFQDIARSIGKYDVATVQNLTSQLNSNDVIQLNVHGIADLKIPSNNRLIFNDTNLYLHQVLNMDFTNKITLLTACETGIGPQYKGEGVYSMARGFIYAGCSSVIMSLSKISETDTQELMPDFYSSLLSGKSVDESLIIAKRNYLDKSDNITSHPRFWTGLVSVGNMQPVESNISSGYKNIYYTIILCLVLSIFIYIIRRIRY